MRRSKRPGVRRAVSSPILKASFRVELSASASCASRRVIVACRSSRSLPRRATEKDTLQAELDKAREHAASLETTLAEATSERASKDKSASRASFASSKSATAASSSAIRSDAAVLEARSTGRGGKFDSEGSRQLHRKSRAAL
jgi:hypothetical protein